MELEVVKSVLLECQLLGVRMWSACGVRKVVETGVMACDGVSIYFLSAATVGIWIVNSI